jgi:hypothetical protein
VTARRLSAARFANYAAAPLQAEVGALTQVNRGGGERCTFARRLV